MKKQCRVLSDYAAAYIAEGVAFAGMCIGLGMTNAEGMWWFVVLWAICIGPSKSIRDSTENATHDESKQESP